MNMIQPYADVITRVTRTNPITGKLQYRHWNETKHCWIEPD